MNDIAKSLRRGAPRILLLAAIALAFLTVSFAPELLGARGGPWPTIVPIADAFGRVFLGLALGDLALRILQPKVDPQQAAMAATDLMAPAMPPAIVYAARMALAAVVLILAASAARAAEPPAAAVPLLPMLKAEQRAWWPAMPLPSALGGQIEQETCPSLKSAKCWNARTELRTDREQGVGLAQLTRTWNRDGSQRFDALTEIVRVHPRELAGLSWQNRLDPRLQLRALVLKDLDDYRVTLGTATPIDHLAMTFASYNGGRGGVSSDRRMCAATPGCDPARWFGNVERTSRKAKTAAKGYGKSFFETNREYPHNILLVRRLRYLGLDT
jgi:hypothetical protein